MEETLSDELRLKYIRYIHEAFAGRPMEDDWKSIWRKDAGFLLALLDRLPQGPCVVIEQKPTTVREKWKLRQCFGPCRPRPTGASWTARRTRR